MFYSHRLGEIADTSLQTALDHFDLGRFLSAHPIPFGLFGQNLFITATTGEYVFRGAAHYARQFPTECHFANLLQDGTGVPVPWPYLTTADSGPFRWPWGYAIMPRLPGVLLADPVVYNALIHSQRTNLARSQGMLLWRLQQATCPFAGAWDIDTSTIQSFPAGYVVRAHDRAIASATRALSNGGHNLADHAWLVSVLASLCDLPDPDRYTVVHEDFNRNNMTAAVTGDTVEITGLVDLMTCHGGDGLADLARQFSMYLAEPEGADLTHNFVHTYLDLRGPLDDQEFQRSQLYLIDERLLVWDYATRPGNENLSWWEPGQTLREWLTSYLDGWSQVINPGHRSP